MSSDPGSRIANSSSSPTVRFCEAAKTSWAPSRSITRTGVLGQVEVERVEQVDGRAGRVHRDVGRDLQQRLGVVEDDLDAGGDEVVGQGLGGGRGDGEHADDDV